VKRNILIFGIGMGLAIFIGWTAFPRALYIRQNQPLEFHHKTHSEKSGLAQCDSCHVVGTDGEFNQIAGIETCAGCHAEKVGTSKAEATLVDLYIKPSRETPWLVYSRQPANVWFSHAIHTRRAELACKDCHGNMGETDQVRVYEQNRISGYSRDIWGQSISRVGRAPGDGMTMSDCEGCHRRHNVEVGCIGCHK
jgi:hypothetical protein